MSITNRLKTYFLKEQFKPSFIGIFINPFYFARKALYKNIKDYSVNISGMTLDIGCGSKPYLNLFKSSKYIGLDVEASGHKHNTSQIDVFYDGKRIPFNDNYFDSVVCFEVLELVFNPEYFLKEANRVLKTGGLAIFTVPFMWDESEPPFDYARYTSFGLKYLFENNGFTVVKSKKYLCDLRILTLLLNVYIYKVIKRLLPSKVSILLILPFTAIINLLSHILYLFPGNRDMYFGNIFLIKKSENN